MYILLTVILLILLVFLFVLLVRTLRFRPREEPPKDTQPVSFDLDQAVKSLQTLLRFPTISHRDSSQEDDRAFEGFIAALPTLYPHVFSDCDYQRLGPRSLLFCWRGNSPENPTVLTAHFDVVPVEESHWEKPPFGAVLENGILWGRGSLDTKITLNAALTAADTMIAQGFVPASDIYFGFSGNEEIYGNGADVIVDYLKDHGIAPAMVIDEGGAVVQGVFPGVTLPSGLIGIAEKGLMDVVFTSASQGGHASAPKPRTNIGGLARACCRIESHPFTFHLTDPVAEMFDVLGRHSGFLYRMIFSNLWCFSRLLDRICKKSGGDLNALMRTTVAFTQMKGSDASNVMPSEATMVANVRLNPMDSCDGALAYLKQVVGDDTIEITTQAKIEPSHISPTDGAAYRKVASAVASTWTNALVAPYLMVQCSDSRRYERICPNVYRFSAMDLTAEERASIHGDNEKVRIVVIGRAVEFYIRLIRQC
jgi:carboxypeptidase PM20D1